MRRTAIHLTEVADLRHLTWAFWRAARGKRRSPEVQDFALRLGENLGRLGEEIRCGTVQVGTFHRFEIFDPKRREIHAPGFRERVLQHALMAYVEPVIERFLVDDTFACRRGKGPEAAARRAQMHSRRWPWFLKMDMTSYFASIHHETLLALIARRIKGRGVLELIERIVRSYRGEEGVGLPIGALTSQHFANLYLAPLDRWLLEEKGAGGMTRYMDDVAAWGEGKASLRQVLEGARCLLKTRLHLEIKSTWQLQRSSQGLTFCGFRIWPHRLGVSQRRRTRYRAARRRWERAYLEERLDEMGLQQGYAAARAILGTADTAALRRRDLGRRPGPEV